MGLEWHFNNVYGMLSRWKILTAVSNILGENITVILKHKKI